MWYRWSINYIKRFLVVHKIKNLYEGNISDLKFIKENIDNIEIVVILQHPVYVYINT